MEYRHEIIFYKDHLRLKLFIHRVGHIPRHWHSSIEMLFVLVGDARIIVGDKSYRLQEEDIILINSNNIHEILADNCVMLALQLDLSHFDNELIDGSRVMFDCISADRQNRGDFDVIKSLLAQLIQLSMEDAHGTDTGISAYGLRSKEITYRLLRELAVKFNSSSTVKTRLQTQKHLDRMSRILGYIDNHSEADISLNGLAEQEHFSAAYLSRFFKKHMSVNFYTYLQGVRLAHAANELLSTDLSIAEIALKTGFPNSRSLAAAFRNGYGVLPNEYRKQDRAIAVGNGKKSNSINYLELKQSDYLAKLLAYLPQDRAEEAGLAQEPATAIQCRVDVSGEGRMLRHTFKNLLCVGRAKEILYADIQDALKTAQKEIGFKYVRFHGLLGDDMMVYAENEAGEPDLSFTYVDKVLDFVLSIGLKPFVQFSFMPRLLAAKPEKTICYNPFIISAPNDMDKWCRLITGLTLHFVQRYGISEVASWPFTVWNEPDSPPEVFGFDSDTAFYELFRSTYQSVKEVSPALQFGGPSFMNLETEEHEGWIERFLAYCRENACEPDYINFHFYPIVKAPQSGAFSPFVNTKTVFSENPDYLRTRLNALKSRLAGLGYAAKPLYLTEWNSTTLHCDPLNDTCFKAAYIVKNILENFDDVDAFGYWVLSDMLEECRMGNKLFHGGLGMSTFNGIKKPAYHAYALLNKVGSTLLDRGDGYFVTRGGDGLQVMLYNYVHYNSMYAVGEVMLQTHTQRYTPFPATSDKLFSIILQGLENGDYTVTECYVNRESGSCFDKWVEMGAQPLVSRQEVELLKALSNPMYEQRRALVENNKLLIDSKLDPHEIRLIEVRKV